MRWWWSRGSSRPERVTDDQLAARMRAPADWWRSRLHPAKPQPHWSDLLGGWIEEPTQPLPLMDRPLMTPGQRWRSRRNAR